MAIHNHWWSRQSGPSPSPKKDPLSPEVSKTQSAAEKAFQDQHLSKMSNASMSSEESSFALRSYSIKDKYGRTWEFTLPTTSEPPQGWKEYITTYCLNQIDNDDDINEETVVSIAVGDLKKNPMEITFEQNGHMQSKQIDKFSREPDFITLHQFIKSLSPTNMEISTPSKMSKLLAILKGPQSTLRFNSFRTRNIEIINNNTGPTLASRVTQSISTAFHKLFPPAELPKDSSVDTNKLIPEPPPKLDDIETGRQTIDLLLEKRNIGQQINAEERTALETVLSQIKDRRSNRPNISENDRELEERANQLQLSIQVDEMEKKIEESRAATPKDEIWAMPEQYWIQLNDCIKKIDERLQPLNVSEGVGWRALKGHIDQLLLTELTVQVDTIEKNLQEDRANTPKNKIWDMPEKYWFSLNDCTKRIDAYLPPLNQQEGEKWRSLKERIDQLITVQ